MTVIVRSFDVDLEATDGRTIVGRCVPYDVPSTVADPPNPVTYREVWRPGAFRHVLKAANRVRLNYEHEARNILNVVGHAVDLHEQPDGLHGTFRAVGAPGDQALELIRSGTVRGLSVAVVMHERGNRNADGMIERIRVARLDHVALTASPAYADAGVMAVRSAPGVSHPDQLGEILDWTAAERARYPRAR